MIRIIRFTVVQPLDRMNRGATFMWICHFLPKGRKVHLDSFIICFSVCLAWWWMGNTEENIQIAWNWGLGRYFDLFYTPICARTKYWIGQWYPSGSGHWIINPKKCWPREGRYRSYQSMKSVSRMKVGRVNRDECWNKHAWKWIRLPSLCEQPE